MSIHKRWKLLGALGATVIIAIACGDDSGSPAQTPPPGNGEGSMLTGAVAGKPCTQANQSTECGPGGTCSSKQTLGTLSELLGLVGLGDVALSAPNGYCTTACRNDSQCGEGGVCFGSILGISEGECRKTCTANTDCREGYECAKVQPAADGGLPSAATTRLLPSQCQAKPTPTPLTPGTVGTRCGDLADGGVASCASGFCAVDYCSGTCLDDSTCGGGACLVTNFYGTNGTCQETCNVDTDCKRYTAGGNVGCIDVEGRKLCGPKLFPLEPNVVGKACADNTNCGSTGECAKTLNNVPAPEGYCSLRGCQDDTVCGGGVCVGFGPLTRCYDSCTSDTDCRNGYSCQDRVTTGDVNSKVCAPAAGDAGMPSSNVPDAGVASGDAG